MQSKAVVVLSGDWAIYGWDLIPITLGSVLDVCCFFVVVVVVFFVSFAFLINDEMVYLKSLFYNHVCFHRRSKAHQSLCLLLCTVMPSLNTLPYLISCHCKKPESPSK